MDPKVRYMWYAVIVVALLVLAVLIEHGRVSAMEDLSDEEKTKKRGLAALYGLIVGVVLCVVWHFAQPPE